MGIVEKAGAKGHFWIVCRDRLGKVLWIDDIENLWTTEGKNDCLNQYFGGTALAALYVGLISSTSYSAVAAGDTAAQINGSNAWKEAATANDPHYSQATRPALTLAAASGGSRATGTAAQFSVTTNGTVKGCFTCSASAKDGTTGKLITAGLFSSGDKIVTIGVRLDVTWTGSL